MTDCLLLLNQSAPSLDVWSLVMESGPMAKLVLFVLGAFSVASWGITAERWRRFGRAERESDEFMKHFEAGGGLAEIQDRTAALDGSPLAAVYRAGFREISLNPPREERQSTRARSLEAVDRRFCARTPVQAA